jgi:hypothetical protein
VHADGADLQIQLTGKRSVDDILHLGYGTEFSVIP